MSLDIFCNFEEIKHAQNIMDGLKELKYLSFISNGIETKNMIFNEMPSGDYFDVDFAFQTLQIPENIVYLKYCGEILVEHRATIYLDLSKLQKTQSLKFVDCCIDDIVLLEGISKFCSDSVQFIS